MNNYTNFFHLPNTRYEDTPTTKNGKLRKSEKCEISLVLFKCIEVVGKLCSKNTTVGKITELNAQVKELDTKIYFCQQSGIETRNLSS